MWRIRSRAGLRLTATVVCVLALWTVSTAALQKSDSKAGPLKTADDIRALLKNGKYADAETAARELLAATEAQKGSESAASATALDLLVQALWRGGKMGEPETMPLARRAVILKEKVFGAEHLEVANSLNNLGCVCLLTGDYAGAKSAFGRTVAIREKVLGPDHADVAAAVENLGIVHMQSGDYAGARPLYERSLSIKEKTQGRESLPVAVGLNNLANLLQASGDLQGARTMHERAMVIREKLLGPDHPDVAMGESNIANVLSASGYYSEAVSHARRAVTIFEKILGPEHPDLARALNNLGSALDDLGEYTEARSVYERALAIREKALGSGHEYVAESLVNLANLCRQIGDFGAARPMYERAVAIDEKVLGLEHPSLAYHLANLAGLLGQTGDRTGAKALFERATAIQEKALGPEHPHLAFTLNELAILLGFMGDFDAARPQFERALHIREKSIGPVSPVVGQTLFDLATMLFQSGNLAAARPLYERSTSIREQTIGPRHPEVARSKAALAELLLASEEHTLALHNALQAEDIGRAHLRLVMRALPERQALLCAATRATGLDVALSLATQGLDGESRARAWDAKIRSRALVLDELASRHRSLVQADDPETSHLAGAFRSARQRLANLTFRGPRDDDPRLYRSLLDAASRDREEAEKALAERDAKFQREQARIQIGFGEVAKAVPPGGALVAYALYGRHVVSPRRGDGGTSKIPRAEAARIVPSYVGFVLRAGESEPFVIDLGDAGEIDHLAAEWRNTASFANGVHGGAGDDVEARCLKAGEALRHRIWDPLAPRLEGAQRLFVVPDGALHLVNLAALPTGQARFLVDDGPLLHELSTERDLLREGAGHSHAVGLLALGGPDFNATMRAARPPPRPVRAEDVDPTRSGEEPAYRGARPSCGDFASIHFGPLPASKREVREISDLWSRSREGTARVEHEVLTLTGAAANETAFKSFARGRRVLHLATHAFFLGGRCASALESSRGIGQLTPVESTQPLGAGSENPLLLSGLVLGGANRRVTAGAGEDDGILTADEIAALDFTGVEWAVLSACDTGVGEVRAGEGVFGLRRAFQVAGAGTLIMSLWSVEDESARRWMKALYEGRLVQGLDTAAAVRAANSSVLNERRRKHESTHPFYWASFVAAGDWR